MSEKNIWVTSDSHFGHSNIVRYCNRPWDSVDEMNDGLIDRWNASISPDDTVYHLGDFTLSRDISLVDEWLGRLNGKIRFIRGNHDVWTRKSDRIKNSDKIKWIQDYAERNFIVDGVKHKVVMCHFPMLFWHGSHYGSIHLHGHCHGGADKHNVGLRRYDVGVDANNWKPINLHDLIRRLSLNPINKHHDDDR